MIRALSQHKLSQTEPTRQFDLLGQARRLLQRAEECRVVAETMTYADTRAAYLRFAGEYERLADQLEKLAAIA
jgi:hypothetical protein